MGLIEELKLRTDGHISVAVAGAGGKTSVVRQLCREYRELGKRVIMTTSTHMFPDPELTYVEWTEYDELKRILDTEGAVHTGRLEPVKNGVQKVASPDMSAAYKLNELCDALIYEADGAMMKCIKVPAPWEPVIWDFTDVVIGVLGADAIGKTIDEVAYRPDDLAAFLGRKVTDCIETEDIIRIASSGDGLRKCVGNKEFRFILNKMDLIAEPQPVEAAVEAIGGICYSFRNTNDND